MVSSDFRRRLIAGAITLAIAAGTDTTGLGQEWLTDTQEISVDESVATATVAEARRDRKTQESLHSFHNLSPLTQIEVRHFPPPIPPAQASRWKELGLEPITTADNRKLGWEAAFALQNIGNSLRSHRLVTLPGGGRSLTEPWVNNGDKLDSMIHQALSESVATWTSAENDLPVAALAQMLCVESEMIRLGLVRQLARRKGTRSSAGLARLALYDLSPAVRRKAAESLKNRPVNEYRGVLLTGFRHPWPGIATHATDALLVLRDPSAVPELRKLLREPDPRYCTDEGGKPMVREMVRVNHLRNCLLCHAPSLDTNDFVRAVAPHPDVALVAAYYEKRQEDLPNAIFVRADITYLRQDFSVMLPVNDEKSLWPKMQRFDFLVRTRPALAAERKAMNEKGNRSPQREAILRALDGLK